MFGLAVLGAECLENALPMFHTFKKKIIIIIASDLYSKVLFVVGFQLVLTDFHCQGFK